MKHGVGVALVGLIVYVVACVGLGPLILKLSLIPLIPLTVYSLLKRFTPLCHYGIGVALGFAPLGASVAVRELSEDPGSLPRVAWSRW